MKLLTDTFSELNTVQLQATMFFLKKGIYTLSLRVNWGTGSISKWDNLVTTNTVNLK